MMKDAFGENIKIGDTVAYVIRSGSSVTIEKRKVVGAGKDFIQTECHTSRWVWDEATRTGKSVPIKTNTTLKTPHLLVRMAP